MEMNLLVVVVWLVADYCECAVELFEENGADELVGEGHSG